eukprot:g34083.t1
MWELANPIASCSDHICSKSWLLEDLWLRVDELESELQTLRHIREGKKYLDALFQEAVTPGRLSTSNSVSDQGQQGVIASEADKGFLSSGTGEPQLLTLSNGKNMPAIHDKEIKVGEDLETIIIMKEVVLDKLMELKVDKSPGPNGMHPRLLKVTAGETTNALVVIFQNSLDSEAVSADCKIANVTPMFKEG